MTQKEKDFIDALCDEYGMDYPERQTDECYEETLKSCNFTSGCYIKGCWLSLANIVRVARKTGLLDDDD